MPLRIPAPGQFLRATRKDVYVIRNLQYAQRTKAGLKFVLAWIKERVRHRSFSTRLPATPYVASFL